MYSSTIDSVNDILHTWNIFTQLEVKIFLTGIHRSSRLDSPEVDAVVEDAVSHVGPSYGRRTLNGLLRSEGIIVGEQRVRESMRRVTPIYIERRRRESYRQLNPMPYYAEYHGHKMHVDQNEKLVRFGVTHVAASDGYSGKILGIATMPVKHPVTIYDELYRYCITVLVPYFSSFAYYTQNKVL